MDEAQNKWLQLWRLFFKGFPEALCFIAVAQIFLTGSVIYHCLTQNILVRNTHIHTTNKIQAHINTHLLWLIPLLVPPLSLFVLGFVVSFFITFNLKSATEMFFFFFCLNLSYEIKVAWTCNGYRTIMPSVLLYNLVGKWSTAKCKKMAMLFSSSSFPQLDNV